MLDAEWDVRLRLYITATVQNYNHKMLAINNMPDHLHLFIGLNPQQSISDLMRIVKSDSAEWINKEGLTKSRFQWQQGYGAFSHSRSQISQVAAYIQNQQEHHKKVTFMDEYRKMLQDFEVEYDEKYIFSPFA